MPKLKLLMLPGLDGTGNLFAGFVAALGESFDITTANFPTGLSFSYAELEDFVREICPASEPFVLLAESYSTPAAINYAAGNPTNLRGLILCAGFATSPIAGWRRFLASFFALVVFYAPMPDFAARRWLVGEGASASLLVSVKAAIASVQPRVLAERLRTVLACDVRGAVGEIKVPTLYIRAELDRLVGASCAEDLERLNPQIVQAHLNGPHLLLQREPRIAAETVLAFVRSRCVS